MEGNFHYFIGTNTFALREEKLLWERRFTERHGAENLLVLAVSGLTYRMLLDEIGVAPFIAQKRLVIVEGTPNFSKEEILMLPALLHSDCILLVCDAAPDRRLAAVRAFLSVAHVKEFAPLHGGELREWMRNYAAVVSVPLERAAEDTLLRIVGEDQDTLARELQKLALFALGRSINADDVERLSPPSGEHEVWKLTQFLSERRRADALRYARVLLMHGEDPFSLWNLLLWMLRSLTSVYAAVADGECQPAKIAAQYHIPFPSVRTLLPIVRRLTQADLMHFLHFAVDADRALKTGAYRATKDAPHELHALIDAFIIASTA